jgi:hypothetical protein
VTNLSPRNLVLCGLVALLAARTFPVAAQSAATSAPSASATTDARPAFQSSGLQLSINNVGVQGYHDIVAQVVVLNATKLRQYLLVFGSHTAALDTGKIGELNGVSGINACYLNGSNDQMIYDRCKDTMANVNYYTYIEPGETAAVSLKFGYNDVDKAAKTISFSFKAIVRTAVGDADPLADPSKGLSPPRVVNINLPLIPINRGQ